VGDVINGVCLSIFSQGYRTLDPNCKKKCFSQLFAGK